MAGICLIRLRGIRPAFVRAAGGLRSENAAHRIAVQWEEPGATREGVYIPRRDTDAWFNRVAGGRLFPGVHHAAEFHVHETSDRFALDMRSNDRITFVRIHARLADHLPVDSVFHSLEDASEFFRAGSLGWSSRSKVKQFDGLELHCEEWRMEPLAVDRVESSFFENSELFPSGSVKFDSGFLMRNIPHQWRARGRLTVETAKL